MSVIVPCVTVETDEFFKLAMDKISGFAQRIQIDISDGEFAPVFMVPPEKVWWPQGAIADIHAMVMRPEEYVDRLISLKPHLIIFHAEVQTDLKPIFEKIKKYGIKTGLALLKPTVPASVADLIRVVDHVLIFSGDLGHYGGVASLMQLEKVRLIRAINPNVEIGWDGGVSVDNAFTLSQGGVDVLNTGGAINKAEDPASVYDKLIQEINKQGII